MSQSARTAPIVDLVKEKHPNADLLSIVRIEGFQCVINTAQWEGINKAFYIEPETVVDTTRPEFSFLKRDNRDKEVIKARRIRNEFSVGLLIPVPEGFQGDDGWEYLGLEHYEPSEDSEVVERLKSGDSTSAPPYWGSLGKYDIENWRKYKGLFKLGEPVCIQEKLNGSNISCVYSDGEYHVKSRNFWKKESEGSDFWKALKADENLMKYLRDNPNHLVQGELIGKVKGFTYGLTNGQVKIAVFDIREPSYRYMDNTWYQDMTKENNLLIPRQFAMNAPYSDELVLSHVDGEQWNAPGKIREGVVVKPIVERFEYKLNGRLALKCVSNAYLEKS